MIGRPSAAGDALARMLACSWREEPPAPVVTEVELTALAPRLVAGGGAGLTWWRLARSGSPLAAAPAARGLREAHRLQALRTALREAEVAAVAGALAAEGLTVLLGKGLAAGRLYPGPGSRPCGDIDLYAPEPEHARARAVLATRPAEAALVDLHAGFGPLDDRPADEILARRRTHTFGAARVSVFGPEDHLRLLCLHLLGHGAWRPLWLCDVAAAVEARPTGFDWNWLVEGDPRRSDAVACALRLAHELLGMSLDGVPAGVAHRRLPRWLAPAVLRQWGRAGFQPHGARVPLGAELRRPWRVPAALVRRWPNGIEATLGTGAPFNDWPRLPFQLGECVRRSGRFARSLVRRAA